MELRILVHILLPLLFLIGIGKGQQQQQQQPLLSNPVPKRVAIIGAGAAGASTAYYLRNLTLNAGIPLSITIYERNTYIGGRSTTVNAFDLPTEPVELGASIFVSVNHNLVNAVRQFNLSTTAGISGRRPRSDDAHRTRNTPTTSEKQQQADEEEDQDTLLGIWNGVDFVFTQPTSTPSTRFTKWYRSLRLLYHYGLAPLRILRLVNNTVSNFLKLYEPEHFPFPNLTAAVRALGISEIVGASGWDVLRQQGLKSKFAWEVVQAATRVNYASALEGIHGMGMLVSMATDGAMGVEGGNWQIFDNMIFDAGADVCLGTAVETVRKSKNGGYVVGTRPAALDEDTGGYETAEETFDTVVLAAPFHQSNISFPPGTLPHVPANDTYRTLHVTLFSSPHRLSRSYFKISQSEEVPTTILTTLPNPPPFPSSAAEGKDTTQQSRKGLPFYSISTLRSVTNPHTSRREYLYKIFSPAPFDNASIAGLLDRPAQLVSPMLVEQSRSSHRHDDDGSSSLPLLQEADVTWIHRKRWLSYPILKPRVSFEPLRLDVALRKSEGGDWEDGGSGEGGENVGKGGGDEDESDSEGRAGGIWYTSGIEGFISTMETSSLMGANVARLIFDEWIGRWKQQQ